MTTIPAQILAQPAGRPSGRSARAAAAGSPRGTPAVWLMGAALALCLAMIVAIVAVIAVRGSATFWPGPIDRVTLTSGETFLGVPLETVPAAVDTASEPPADAEPPMRRRYRVGNRDLGQQSFRWVLLSDIASTERPRDAVLVERREWGVFLGQPAGVRTAGQTASDGGLADIRAALPAARARQDEIESLNASTVPQLQERLTRLSWDRRALDRRLDAAPREGRWPVWLWATATLGAIAAAAGAWRVSRTPLPTLPPRQRLATLALVCVAVWAGTAAVLERPWSARPISAEQHARLAADLESRSADLQEKLDAALARVAELRAEQQDTRVLFVDPKTGRFAPRAQSEPDEPMTAAQVVRIVPANALDLPGRVGVYLSRWWEFLSAGPREGGAEGGVWPVILGTVTLTMLLTITVLPLGVIAAVYLREYARQGVVTSIVRIAINNLAGVPSIVYGMFGLGFFCYAVGGYVDGGPAAPIDAGAWWGVFAGALALILAGAGASVLAGRADGAAQAAGRWAATGCWIAAVVLAAVAVARTPYFHGFFSEKLPESPTFGGRGILWAALTLALLTLPVVIVATEEALAAVPRSMREGSLASGASRWQTIRRIVLPAALPGIMTGAILAMARGAGEVAPLMLVGAVNFNPALPVTGQFPFLHGDRTFMHLGFHIYNLGFQSPDSEATQPLVWTTTLLLITLVLALNLAAITIRARLRAKLAGPAI